MPITTVEAPDGQKIKVEHPAGAAPAEIISYAQKQWRAPSKDLPPLLQNITQSPSQMQKTEGQPVEQRGIVERMAGSHKGMGSTIPGLISGVAEKLGMLPANADRLMRDLGILQTGAEIEAGKLPQGQAEPAPRPGMMTPETPTLRSVGDVKAAARADKADPGAMLDRTVRTAVPREVAEDVGTAVQNRAAGMKQATNTKYETAFSQPGEVHASAFEGLGTKLKGQLGQDPTLIVDATTPVTGKALKYLDEGISKFNIPNKVGPQLSQSMREDIAGINMRGVEQVRKNLNQFYKDAARNPSDRRAMKALKDAYDDHLEDAFRQGLFSGDPAVLEKLKAARASSAEYKSMFEGRDAVSKAFKAMAEGRATAQEIGNFFWGANKIGATTLPVKMWRQWVKLFGDADPITQQIKSAVWSKAKGRPQGAAELYKSELGRAMFSPEELNALRQYALKNTSNLSFGKHALVEGAAHIAGHVPVLGRVARPLVRYGGRKLLEKQKYGGVQ